MHYGPIKRRDLIDGLKKFGYGTPIRPRPGSDHWFMPKGDFLLKIPNEHHQDIRRDELADVLGRADISRKQWEEMR